MIIEQIISCLEQKVLLLTKILDLTKQIEVRCSQSEIVLDDFLSLRSSFMERVDKCDRLIANLLSQLSNDQQSRLQVLLESASPLHGASEKEELIFKHSRECASLIQHAMSIDRCANEVLRKQYREMKEKLNVSRKTTPL